MVFGLVWLFATPLFETIKAIENGLKWIKNVLIFNKSGKRQYFTIWLGTHTCQIVKDNEKQCMLHHTESRIQSSPKMSVVAP